MAYEEKMPSIKKIVVLGGKSQLGADIKQVFGTEPGCVVELLSRTDVDVTNPVAVTQALIQFQPDVVINTAAYHKVDEVETNLDQAFLVNATAQKNIAEAANLVGATMVFLSTDYVFGLDQERRQPYTEMDRPGPVNIYGVSKVAGEHIVRRYAQKYFITRVSGLFGQAGSAGKGGNFVETMIKLGREKGMVKVVNDQILSPTYTVNVAETLFQLVQTQEYGTYHLTSKGQCSWWEFASEIFQQLKLDVDCQPVPSSEIPTVAQRPRFSVLAKTGLERLGLNQMRDWQTNLHLYLQQKGHLT